MFLDALEDARSADHGRVQQLLLDVCHVEVEGTGGVDYGFERGVRLHGLVESAFDGDVFDDGEVELVLADVGVGFGDFVGFVLAADGGDDGVSGVVSDV